MNYDKELDLSGLNCPIPILRTKAALASMQSGEVLRIKVTNDDSVREFRLYAEQTGGKLEQLPDDEDAHVMLFTKR